MAIFIDQITTHDGSNTGDNTVPPGITDQDWCHLVSDVSAADLLGWLTANFLTVQKDPLEMRTPELGSLQTYAGLNADQRDQAILAGAHPGRVVTVRIIGFDSPGGPGPGPFWEP